MKDSTDILQTKYFEKLTGIQYNGEDVPIYDSASVDANASTPYIVIGDFLSTAIGEMTKDTFGTETYVTIEIISKFGNSFGGKKMTSIIADQVIGRIAVRQPDYLDLSPDFYMILSELDNSQTLVTPIGEGVLVQRILRFKHLIEENI